MGCGAVCGNNSSIYEPNQYSQKIMSQMISQLNYSKLYISPRQYHSFIRSIKQNPLRYRLNLSQKLLSKQQIDPGILTKWKVILYCYDSTNSDFYNCLAFKFKKKQSQQSTYHKEQKDKQIHCQEDNYILHEDNIIYQHEQFNQIQKDINRTCQLPENKKKIFERILKRITNYFPQMGYTQGINFIIGYLLMVGYSQFDAFWMFVHLATHRRYLQLGLLEEQFPLSKIYNCVFKTVLKRLDKPLYHHFYEKLQIHESAWVFKWFITFFIYSFPFEMIKYVFDVVIEMGGIGLIKFAVAITLELSDILITGQDACQVSQFFQSLKTIDSFNKYLSLTKVLQRVYTLQITRQDFKQVEQNQGNFYSDYIMINISMHKINNIKTGLIKIDDLPNKNKNFIHQYKNNDNNDAGNILLKNWYQKLIDERQNWILKKQKGDKKYDDKKYDDKKKQQKQSIQSPFLLLVDQSQPKEQKSPQRDEKSISDNKNSVKDSTQVKKQSVPSTGYSFHKKSGHFQNQCDVSEIDELWEQEDKNSSISKNRSSKLSQQSRTQNGFNIKPRKTSYEDELDKLATTQGNPLGKSKTNLHSKGSSIFNEQKFHRVKPKINNYQVPCDNTKIKNLVRIGENIITNINIHYQYQNDSQNQYIKLSQKQKRTKQNDIYGKNYKKKSIQQIRNYQNSSNIQNQSDHTSHDQNDQNSSSRDSYLDHQNSLEVSNEFNQEEDLKNKQFQAHSVKAFESHRQRMNTHQDVFTVSLHTSHIKQSQSKQITDSHISQIQIFQAPQVFKKKKRVSSRINDIQNDILSECIKLPKLTHKMSDIDIDSIQKGKKSLKAISVCKQQGSIYYEQSCESLFVPSEDKKSNSFRFQQQLQKCEIESVK